MAFALGETIGDLGANILRRAALENAAAASQRQQEKDFLRALVQVNAQRQQARESNALASALADADRQFKAQQLAEQTRQFDAGLSAQSRALADQLAAQERIAQIQTNRVDPRIEVARIGAETDRDLMQFHADQEKQARELEARDQLAAIRKKNQEFKATRDSVRGSWMKPWFWDNYDIQNARTAYQESLRPLMIEAEKYGFQYDPISEDFYLPRTEPAPTGPGPAAAPAPPPNPMRTPIPLLSVPSAAIPGLGAQASPSNTWINAAPSVVRGPLSASSPDPQSQAARRQRLRELINSGMDPREAARMVVGGR